jgi:adenylate kinase
VPALVFLGGIHGVGKSTVCDRVFVPAGYHCVTASSLIMAYGLKTDQNKRVGNISNNQTALIEQFKVEKKSHKRLLLDGHYCLINSQNQFSPIDVDVFRKMNPELLILLKNNPEEIAKRLSKRDEKKWDQSFLAKFQIAEEKHAQRVSSEIGIPLRVYNNEQEIISNS